MLAVLMAIGFIDLISTAVLHAKGLIIEVNPLMRPLIEHNEWTFAFVKSLTLFGAWYVMARHAQKGEQALVFVRQACVVASLAYVAIWTTVFFWAEVTM